MIGNSKYLLNTTLSYKKARFQEEIFEEVIREDFQESFPIQISKRKIWRLILSLSCMTPPCESDQISDTKKILNSVREIFSYYFESSSFYQTFKHNDLDDIFVNLIFDRNESTKPYSVHLVSSCVGVPDEIYRTRITISKNTKSNIGELVLVNVMASIHDYTCVSVGQSLIKSKPGEKHDILFYEMNQLNKENKSLSFKFFVWSIDQIIYDDALWKIWCLKENLLVEKTRCIFDSLLRYATLSRDVFRWLKMLKSRMLLHHENDSSRLTSIISFCPSDKLWSYHWFEQFVDHLLWEMSYLIFAHVIVHLKRSIYIS